MFCFSGECIINADSKNIKFETHKNKKTRIITLYYFKFDFMAL